MPPKVTLTITKGSLSKKTKYKFSGNTISFYQKESLTLGREMDCHIVFSNETVSRYHCLLNINPSSVTVKDSGGSNGTELNGERIDPHNEYPVKTGDRLKLGPDCEIMLEIKRRSDLIRDGMEGWDNAVKIPGYRTIREIGRGGMGIVYLVKEEKTGKRMALKVMLPEKAADETCRKMFLREASLSGQLKHKNVVEQYKYGQFGNVGYILMEYCPGGSVEELMKDKGKLDPALANHIIIQALEGLHYCHHAEVTATLEDGRTIPVTGVVHRDFKPGNILLSGDPSRPDVKIADFGLAKTFNTAGWSGITANDLAAGMMEFMCSEQANNFRYAKPKVDVWAAAACYYYMLTKIYPKDFRGEKDPLSVVCNDPAVPIRRHNRKIPKRVADIIDAALIERLKKPEEVTETALIKRLKKSEKVAVMTLIEKLISNKEPEDSGISALELKQAIESIS